MISTETWWRGEIDWETPAGRLLLKFLALLPSDRRFRMTLYESAPLQLTLDGELLSEEFLTR